MLNLRHLVEITMGGSRLQREEPTSNVFGEEFQKPLLRATYIPFRRAISRAFITWAQLDMVKRFETIGIILFFPYFAGW